MVNSRSKKGTNNQDCLASQHRGVTSIEYALIASLIAIAILAGVTAAGGANAFNWSTWVGKVQVVLGV